MTSQGQGAAREQAPVSLYPEIDEAALLRFVYSLESGDTAGLSATRSEEAAEARALLRMGRVRVPGEGGIELAGFLWRHRDGHAHPAIVMPSPWTDLGWLAYAVQGTLFALNGYHVLAYTARGFGQSGGEVEVAGPDDVADGSAALTYLLDQTDETVRGVGFLGDSYGSGISQLVAAHDTRVTAVAALSTWGDLGQAFYENETRHIASVTALLNAAANARLSARTRQVFEDVLAGQNIEQTLQWAEERSPYTHRDQLNQRRVPVFFANAWHETLFPNNQTLRMFNALEGPKRLDFSIGDHSGPEMSGILGLPNRIWQDAHRWLDHHLKGDANGIDKEGQLVSQVMWDSTLEPSATWEDAVGEPHRLYLAGTGAETGDGALTDKPENGWTRTISTGTDTPATVADSIIKAGYAEMAGNPKVYATRDISRSAAGVWAGAPLSQPARLRGTPVLHLNYASSAATSTFIAHLFDVGPDDSAHIITHAPFTRSDGRPGEQLSVRLDLQATGYDVRAGHRLMLVIDTQDPFYADSNGQGATLTVSSPDAHPSYLDVPLA
ncbi:CocE/NonD family hydrolase [Streptomyces kunmingensis]|uniref:CocE/NonD family hydrolase n=1 Tax=Streptomyces kunmingensis TaxID=68225 RepID=A0ABU6CK20_9ACTN|nr:CocE/NonD family hydrolase [Streptomyces kunmingensis]MEB3965066.1 CocE/NonD family hydrolase [Streptomyces kunmingensis]